MIEHLLSKVLHKSAHVQRQLLYTLHKPAWQIQLHCLGDSPTRQLEKSSIPTVTGPDHAIKRFRQFRGRGAGGHMRGWGGGRVRGIHP